MALENEYLRIEILLAKSLLTEDRKRLRFADEQRKMLAIKGKALGSRLTEVATLVSAQTLLKWHREFEQGELDTIKTSPSGGRPRVASEVEALVLKMARENNSWGYKRISGAMKNLGYSLCPATVSNILRRNGVNPSESRKKSGMTWTEFICIHREILQLAELLSTLSKMIMVVLFIVDIMEGIYHCVNGRIMPPQFHFLYLDKISMEIFLNNPNFRFIEKDDAEIKIADINRTRPPPLVFCHEEYQDAA